ncbi:GYF domain-containing protein [Flavobacterium aquatile]|uniref:GYF domain-containing protein n=1 Tax=Flavobacterium aquatile LMG 4008 = ATCC 11947 TaxID=1453498 RepID=A0A095V2A5_9FLAO|nr:GYF domain-containing protein [Flavobacterium aquatile]KGD68995.1 hypothetical protein LG45_04990 [Flavobacterium aquatile LMG 4008 = ATCC 11947]OXA65706.1 hypothetical protein B0A61_13745 [Flavobacterium aquatile LMG 4008 = ATCC 11947]GEC78153.1 hypothetical protein FAQ01_10230 [Flavobacterium aquatile]
MKQYYISINNEQVGPLSFEELKEKKISSVTMVWFEGQTDWKKASEIDELKDLLKSIPPPINTFTQVPPLPTNESQTSIEDEEDEPVKIMGLSKNIFYTVLTLMLITIVIIVLNSFQNKAEQLQQINNATETHNQQLELQQKEIEEQKARIVEQEKIEAERIARERKQAIENRLSEITSQLNTSYKNLEKAKQKLNDVSAFKLLRTSSDRNQQINTAQSYVDYYTEEIQKLETEYEKINSNK